MNKIAILLITLFCGSALAGFQGFNGSSDLGVMNQLACGDGISCVKVKGKMTMAADTFGQLGNIIAATAGTLTAAQCGSSFVNSGAVALVLPLASGVIGCKYTFITLNASNFDVDPNAANTIFALTNAAGDAIRNATVGNSVTLQAVTGGWAAVAIYGTWTDIN